MFSKSSVPFNSFMDVPFEGILLPWCTQIRTQQSGSRCLFRYDWDHEEVQINILVLFM